ncbi:dienelactone hydrolase family protein [Pseudomonas sp.]|uniref:dienelactone hydrolase family protein n=1 Tax=Pseudomonas sp. TaxID=306 RepID=UPI00261C9A91|nr:dienelactone hydrolase family protein [Pseudomonas sp.]
MAGEDEFIVKSAQQIINRVPGANPDIEIHTYPGRNHAFARPKGDHYDAIDAAMANGRTATFLKKRLALS